MGVTPKSNHSRLVAACLFALVPWVVPAVARIQQNQVAALIVFPWVDVSETPGPTIETFFTVVNTASVPLVAHFAFVDGEVGAGQCTACGFDVPLAALGSAVVTARRSSGTTLFKTVTGTTVGTCPGRRGFLVVDVEDAGHVVQESNVLFGDELVVDYALGTSFSLQALPMPSRGPNDGNRNFQFNGEEYERLPPVIAAEFMAPDNDSAIQATLVLFNLAFLSGAPPVAQCTINGYDASGRSFTSSLQFGCWTRVALQDIDWRFAYPFLGSPGSSYYEHGWVQATCEVQGTGPNGLVSGGIHGALVQSASSGARLRRNDFGPQLTGADAWGRCTSQEIVVGDSVTLVLP